MNAWNVDLRDVIESFFENPGARWASSLDSLKYFGVDKSVGGNGLGISLGR